MGKKEPEGITSGHETTDADAKPIVGFLIALGIFLVLIMIAMMVMFNVLEARFERAGRDISPLLDVKQIPPDPRLQVDPARELAEIEAWENDRLSSYGWVDKDTGVFRIPIERAIDVLVETGLPVRRSEEGKTPQDQ